MSGSQQLKVAVPHCYKRADLGSFLRTIGMSMVWPDVRDHLPSQAQGIKLKGLFVYNRNRYNISYF